MSANTKQLEIYIPEPFNSEQFELLQKGVYDDTAIGVYINEQWDFAFLHPKPQVDYIKYLPRVKKLSLEKYKKQRLIYTKRFTKIRHLFPADSFSLLEIGAGDGSFLRVVGEEFPKALLTAVETDINTDSQREQIHGLKTFRSIEEVCNHNARYEVICLFHVLEHIIEPSIFLSKLKSLMHNDTTVIIEVPSLFDPLLTLYKCDSYKKFYFQTQHPYIYSNTSIVRLMERNGFKTKESINYQRYGLENHLNWLINKTPGGDDLFKNIFKNTDKTYIAEIEKYGKTDTVIYAGKLLEDV